MIKRFISIGPLVSLALLGACSSGSTGPDAASSDAAAATAVPETAASNAAPAMSTPDASATPRDDGTVSPEAMILRLEGLGDLQIGRPIPSGSRFAGRGAQVGGDCTTLTSPAYPGVYAMVEGGVLRRITAGARSRVKLVEGIGVGSSEAEVLKAFPGFVSSPHKYVAAPAKYLTQPGRDPRLRFEIDDTRKVSQIHVGMQPQLSYVEGCA